jgi:hypothetical protein
MTEHDNELLSQYLDGELGAVEHEALEQRLAAEPALQAQFEQMKSVNSAVQSEFSTPDAKNVPPRITRMLEKTASNVVAFPRRRAASWGFAVAASVLAASGALMFSDAWLSGSSAMPSNSPLAQALEHTPSRGEGWDQLADGSQFRPVLSFQSKSGDWCREFALEAHSENWRGVACRDSSGWTTRAIGMAKMVRSRGEYRPAGAGNAAEVSSFVEAEAADIALSSSQEAKLIENSWK